MSFTATRNHDRDNVIGNRMVTGGTYVNDGGSTGGDINTGLQKCTDLRLIPNAASVSASTPVVNETFPCTGSAVTIVTIANESGYWTAEGY